MTETFFGIKLVVNPLIPETAPRMQLNPNVVVTDRFRAEMNTWLLDFFGETKPFYLTLGGTVAIAHPNNINWLKREILTNTSEASTLGLCNRC
jgi:hypothetical protein